MIANIYLCFTVITSHGKINDIWKNLFTASQIQTTQAVSLDY